MISQSEYRLLTMKLAKAEREIERLREELKLARAGFGEWSVEPTSKTKSCKN